MMNSLRSAWTLFLAGRPDPHRQAKGDSEARPSHPNSSYTLYRIGTKYRSGHSIMEPTNDHGRSIAKAVDERIHRDQMKDHFSEVDTDDVT